MTPRIQTPIQAGPIQASRLATRVAVLLAAAILCLGLSSCGSSNTYPPYNGIIVVDNVSHTTTTEILHTFFISPFGQPWTGDILGGDLDPNTSRSLGVWNEDFYDAEGDMELGDVIQWFDIFVGEGATTVFEVL